MIALHTVTAVLNSSSEMNRCSTVLRNMISKIRLNLCKDCLSMGKAVLQYFIWRPDLLKRRRFGWIVLNFRKIVYDFSFSLECCCVIWFDNARCACARNEPSQCSNKFFCWNTIYNFEMDCTCRNTREQANPPFLVNISLYINRVRSAIIYRDMF